MWALTMAVAARGKVADILCHFDRGSQYASDIFQSLLKRYGFTCSMSRKGNCWDNAVAESFFHSLKIEAIYGELFRTRDEARSAVFNWIECFYNPKRRHSALGYVSPAVFEREPLKLPEAA
jgi:transposase InsO family protein